MTFYNVLPLTVYERVFMFKSAKEVWNTLIITHQGNSQVKECKSDLLTQQYEKFSISSEETIDSSFTKFNAIVTNLKYLDQDYSRKNHVRKFLHVLPLKWRAKIEDLQKKGTSISSSTRVIDSGVVIDLVIMPIGLEEAAKIAFRTKEVKAPDKDEVVTIAGKTATSLVSVQSPRRTRLLSKELGVIVKAVTNLKMMQLVSWRRFTLQEVQTIPSTSNNDLDIIELQKENEEFLRFNKDFTKTFEKLLNEKQSLESDKSKLLSKINDLEINVKKLTNNKEVVKTCKRCDVLTQEVDSLKFNVSKLQDEALNFLKFKKSSLVLEDMLSR
ncbi:hypothetical protein Tco_0105641 [Tanacetum coccineum]